MTFRSSGLDAKTISRQATVVNRFASRASATKLPLITRDWSVSCPRFVGASGGVDNSGRFVDAASHAAHDAPPAERRSQLRLHS